MDRKTKRTWISIAIAIGIIFVVLGVAMLGTAFYVFRRHVSAQFVSTERAQEEFQRTRQRFAGQQPLIDLSRGSHEPIIHERTGNGAEIETVRVLAFEPAAGKLVHVSLPFWLLRMTPSKNFTFRSEGDFDFDSDRVHLTVDDLERAGPGLILDTRDPRKGTLVLVWAEGAQGR
jgi:hypothetical protein